MSSLADVEAAVAAAGEKVRELKTAKADKDTIMPAVEELKKQKAALVEILEKLIPETSDAAAKAELEAKLLANKPMTKAEKKKAEKAAKAAKAAAEAAKAAGGAAPAEGGKMSKSQQKKAAAKAEKAAKKAAYKSGNPPAPSGKPAAAGAASGAPAAAAAAAASASTSASASSSGSAAAPAGPSFPFAAAVAARMTNAKYDDSTRLAVDGGLTLYGSHAIARYFARASGGAGLYGSGAASKDPLATSEIDQWMDFALAMQSSAASGAELGARLAVLDEHLALRTYVVGYGVTLADAAVWGSIQATSAAAAAAGVGMPVHVQRWCTHLGSFGAFAAAADAGAKAAGGKKGGAGAGGKKGGAGAGGKRDDSKGSMPDLPGAEDGKVVTRFPPEPSGYLHIGHVKACLLNNHYARRYNGKLIVRFDDTNPSKEKDEYCDAIIKDLATMGISADVVTHTSDHFETLIKYAKQLLKQGDAYMDDTEVEQMHQERMDGINSKRRDEDVKTNLARFAEMQSGSEEGQKWCMRIKMDMQNVNKCLRDPVGFRSNLEPHVRTKTKYKAYPTYDLACPIVDSIEGVTHAMRTTEYDQRNPQYDWVIDLLKLRKPHITTFARVNFKRTVMSKRKLLWFVEEKLVDGWFDPRFPTVQGIMRRGMQVPALHKFMLDMGLGKRDVDMSWDKIWNENKKIIDPTAPRYMAVANEAGAGGGSATLVLTNFADVVGSPAARHGKPVPLHPKDKDGSKFGFKVLHLTPTVRLERQDAAGVKVGDEFTLRNWSNVVVTKVDASPDGPLTITGTLNPDGDFRKTELKATWVPDVDNVPVVLHEFDYLITKDKLEKEDVFEDFVNSPTEAVTYALADPNLRPLRKNTVIQIERRGFYRIDQVSTGPDSPMHLFMIPDGKAKNVSVLSTKFAHH